MSDIERLKDALSKPCFYVRTKDGKEALLHSDTDKYATAEWQAFAAANGGYDNIDLTGWVGGDITPHAIDFILGRHQQQPPEKT